MPPRPGTAIHLGRGPGHPLAAAAERGHRVLGIDGSEAMLALARRRLDARDAGTSDASFEHHTLPLPPAAMQRLEGSADLVLASSVFEYIEDDTALMTQCAALLKPGAYLLASFPNRRSVYWSASRVTGTAARSPGVRRGTATTSIHPCRGGAAG